MYETKSYTVHADIKNLSAALKVQTFYIFVFIFLREKREISNRGDFFFSSLKLF